MTPNQRTAMKSGCSVCSGHVVLAGHTDIETTHTDIASEWSPKNSLRPYEISYGSHEIVIWICRLGHEWAATANSRTCKGGSGCPICSNNVVLNGFNDLATTEPQISAQWDHTKNATKPSEYTSGSNYRAWWLCSNGHSWSVEIRSRRSRGCWSCVDRTSKVEREIQKILEGIGSPLVFNSRTILSGKELDIFIPGLNVALEYNGVYWHSDLVSTPEDYHFNKWKQGFDENIVLLHTHEIDLEQGTVSIDRIVGLLTGTIEPVFISGWVENGSVDFLMNYLGGHTITEYRSPTPMIYSLNSRVRLLSHDENNPSDKHIATVFNAGWSKFE